MSLTVQDLKNRTYFGVNQPTRREYATIADLLILAKQLVPFEKYLQESSWIMHLLSDGTPAAEVIEEIKCVFDLPRIDHEANDPHQHNNLCDHANDYCAHK